MSASTPESNCSGACRERERNGLLRASPLGFLPTNFKKSLPNDSVLHAAGFAVISAARESGSATLRIGIQLHIATGFAGMCWLAAYATSMPIADEYTFRNFPPSVHPYMLTFL